MFNLMPNMVITMPYDAQEAFDLIHYGFMKQTHPFVIRYPRGAVNFDQNQEITFNNITPTWTYLKQGKDPVVMISYGPSLDLLMEAQEKANVDATIVNARFIKPIDEKMLKDIFSQDVKVLVYEEASNIGGLYPQILKYMAKHNHHHKIIEMSITDQVVEHGYYKDMLKAYHMDVHSIVKNIKDLM